MKKNCDNFFAHNTYKIIQIKYLFIHIILLKKYIKILYIITTSTVLRSNDTALSQKKNNLQFIYQKSLKN